METSPQQATFNTRLHWIILAFLLLAGGTLRVAPSAGFQGVGFDEVLYRNFVVRLDQVGLGGYPSICQGHVLEQSDPKVITKLPPTRFLYIFSAWVWKRAEFGDAPVVPRDQKNFVREDPALVSLHRVASLASVLCLGLAALASGRMFDRRIQIGVTSLMAFSPLMIHMSQHALVDGFFAFWAMLSLWLLWENLQHPHDWRRLTGYAISLGLMVLTKENSFFVYVALLGVLTLNFWAGFGSATRGLWLATLVGPSAGLLLLVILAGGVDHFVAIYQLLVSKAQNLEYAIITGDGPWYRYLVDLILISPLVFCLAIGGFFTQTKIHKGFLFLVSFTAFSYVIMCNIPYAMNLRYATIWDFTLRCLAIGQLVWMTKSFGTKQPLVLLVLISALCAYDLHQYVVFFVDGKLYELVTSGLMESVKILKFR